MTPQEVCVFLKLCNATPTRQITAEHPRPWAHIENNGFGEEIESKSNQSNNFFLNLHNIKLCF